MTRVSSRKGVYLSAIGLMFLVCALPFAKARDGTRSSRIPPAAEAIPVRKADVLSFSGGEGVDRQPALAPLPNGGFILVSSSYSGGDMDASTLHTLVSSDGSTVSEPSALNFGGKAEDAPAFITTPQGSWLYFVSSENEQDV
jgi:hypothetical protein